MYVDTVYPGTDSGSEALTAYPVPQPVSATFTLTQAYTKPTPRYRAHYSYNKDGQIAKRSEALLDTESNWSYGYDKNGRLTLVTEDGVTTTYGYDVNGNRITINGASVATYNARDQLLTYGSNIYSWNADGEPATRTTPTGTTHNTWNALAELTDVSLPDGTAIHYIYDGMGRRVGQEKNGLLVAGYLYAGNRIVAKTGASGAVTERFVYGTKPNVPSYMIKYNTDGTKSRYRIVSDQVGSVKEVIDASSGAVVQQIVYDVWGNIKSDTRPGFQPFAFAGGLYDADTKLDHFGARDYDPATGRWISRDPIFFAGGDPNLYRYVVDNPVSGFDSLGLRGSLAQMARGIAGMPLNPSDLAARQVNAKANGSLCRIMEFVNSFNHRQLWGPFGFVQKHFDPMRSLAEGGWALAAEAGKQAGGAAGEYVAHRVAKRYAAKTAVRVTAEVAGGALDIGDVLSVAAIGMDTASMYWAMLDPVTGWGAGSKCQCNGD